MAEKSIKELKKLWEGEKEQYRTSEVGSGVQKFVKEVFKSLELFNLKEGKLNTPDNQRKNEFIEEAKKKGRRADVVIFIDGDIIIPVEVEKHGNIKAGERQLFQYQTDWIKKYGLLTDGEEWRFYNNRLCEKSFRIWEILDNPSNFLAFWNEYINPDYYYRSFFEKKGQPILFEVPVPHLDEVREDFFVDITSLIENIKNKLNLKGYFKDIKEEVERGKKAVEITYAYLIQFILYKVLVDNAFNEFDKDWIERFKSIDKAIKSESYTSILIYIKAISDKISEKIYKKFNKEQEIIHERLQDILSKPKTDITDVSVWLDILLFINRYNFANVQNEIFGYVYENYLKDLYLDEKKGQYFTDPNVVEFMLNEMGYTKENLRKRYSKDKDSISLVDPSCGSGTFLYNATYRIVETFFDGSKQKSKLTEQLIIDNIFGFDIAEFPLYLAEMNILMRMLPVIINDEYNTPLVKKIGCFKTRDSISEFLDTALRNTLSDQDVAFKKQKTQMNLFTESLDLGYESFMRDKNDLNILKNSLENKNKKLRYRYDFVIGNPPYVSYNECASQKLHSFEFMKKGIIKLNDIYGVNLHSVNENRKKYPPKPNLYAFFIALGLSLLKDKGKLCFIIPQTVITESDYDVLRYYLSTFTTIEKIFIFENPMFLGRGLKQKNTISTSSLIFVTSKETPSKYHKIQVLIYDKKEEDIEELLINIKNKKKSKNFKINQVLLQKNYLNWIILKFDSETIELYDEYKNNNESIAYYSEHSLSGIRFNSEFYFDVGFILDKSKYLKHSIKGDEFELIDLKNFHGYHKYFPNEYYPNNQNDIKLPKNSQGYNTLSKKYKIIWGKVFSNKFYFTDRNVLPSMSYTQFISSDNKEELLYLFSLLNSKTNNYIYNKLFRLSNEKFGIFVVVKRIKEFLKIPIITKENDKIKTEIIKMVTEFIELEDITLHELVDFKNILLQKFDNLEIIGNNLIICYKENEAKCKIKEKIEIVRRIVDNFKKNELLNDYSGSVNDLKSMPAFDREYQAQLKDYIDDLVYALYFKIPLPGIGFESREQIKKACSKHKFYKLVNTQ
ncbi:MAG: hypothetical protein HW421_3607 [Ignavibacteria bacterium]|nr:hypothetical protein [Ignavibacteria bacterium]